MRVLILGHGGHGKDAAAEALAPLGLPGISSSAFLAERVVRPVLEDAGIRYEDIDACLADRKAHRSIWFDAISRYCENDRARVSREILAAGYRVHVGIRCPDEFEAARQLFDVTLWIERPDQPIEDPSSMAIQFDEMRMKKIVNDGSLDDLHLVMKRWAMDYMAFGGLF